MQILQKACNLPVEMKTKSLCTRKTDKSIHQIEPIFIQQQQKQQLQIQRKKRAKPCAQVNEPELFSARFLIPAGHSTSYLLYGTKGKLL